MLHYSFRNCLLMSSLLLGKIWISALQSFNMRTVHIAVVSCMPSADHRVAKDLRAVLTKRAKEQFACN